MRRYSMTPGRLVSLDALGGITVAAKIRIERKPQGRLRWLTRGEATISLTACRKGKNQALADLVEFCMFTGVWLMAWLLGPDLKQLRRRVPCFEGLISMRV